MELTKITDLVTHLGLSSRSLRYYEQVGLIQSVRSSSEKYRYYDTENVERLKQIMVLRKMKIPIKDILRIYESADMSVVVETFVSRIRAIDEEVDALTELRAVVNDFLQAMLRRGITKISALPILYEKMEKRLDTLEWSKTVSYQDLTALSDKLAEPVNPAIIDLSPMRVLSSGADRDGFWHCIQSKGMPIGKPGQHEQFELHDEILLRIPDDFVNESEFSDHVFGGGLYAAANAYLDEDLGQRFRALVSDFDDNKFYEIDYTRTSMLENLISPDVKRELVLLLVPVKKRMADHTLFDKPVELLPDSITVSEIEIANPVLWEADVPLDKLTPINNPHYSMAENGEAEYMGWIIRSVLNTNVSVKLPFRVDIEFRQSGEGGGGLVVYHSEDTGYHTGGDLGNMGFGINMGNNANQLVQAISFHQPIFWDYFHFAKRGAVKNKEWNNLTWILGEKHLAVIINGEIRYCGVNFPYMSLNLSLEAAYPIVIGAHGGNDKKYFRSIRVSQLAETKKNKLKEGELAMITKQSNNIIPVIHRLVTDEYGENYWFNGCAKYVMECLGEKDYDYWFFAGLTGDVFTQHYTYTKYSGDALTSYMMDEKPTQFVEDIFAQCGYAATYVPQKDIRKNTEMYLQTLIAYIDKGIPVIMWGNPLGVFVGYEDYGKVLLYVTGNNNQPERIPLNKALEGQADTDGWIFVGDKKKNRPLAELYREAIYAIPQHLSVKTDRYCFGAEAFRAWARDIENGKFDGMTIEEFDTWAYYTNYICVLATNGSCCHEFLKRTRELNPDMGYLEEVSALYRRTAEMWGGKNNRNDADSLEALGGGFNVTLEALQDKERRDKIVAKIREFADVTDEIVQMLNENMK